MDRRKKRTKKLIDTAFQKLLSHKKYKNITVQDIIDEADIGRSTFYAHFETKDDLLLATCHKFFDHIFVSEELCGEGECYFDHMDFEQVITHMLHHIYENKNNLKGLLFSGDVDIFTIYFNDKLMVYFSKYLHQNNSVNCSKKGINVPEDYLKQYIVNGFVQTVRWWLKRDNMGECYSPNQVAKFYMQVNSHSINMCV